MSAVHKLRPPEDPYELHLRTYGLALDTLMRDLTPEGRRYRCALMALRDRSGLARHKATAEADQLLAGINSLASIYSLSGAADNELLALYDNLQAAFQAAINIHTYGPRS
jgi:hypothetical protein